MPSQAILSEKQAVVDTLAQRLQEAQGGVLVDYRGINVAQDTELRRDLRAENVEYTVVKNTLTKLAMEKVGLTGLEDQLNGTTSLATSAEDPLVPLYKLTKFSENMGDTFTLKGVFIDGKVLSAAEIAELSDLPSRDALYSRVLGTMLAPITSLAVVLNQVAEKGGAPAAEAPAEAPAADAAPAEEAPAEAPVAEEAPAEEAPAAE